MADQNRNQSNQNRGQGQGESQRSGEPQQSPSERSRMQDDESGGAERNRGSWADDRGRTERQNARDEQGESLDRDIGIESDLDDPDDQTDMDSEDDEPAGR